ncbi:protein serine/threonine phosphatase 2C [Myriangium duriaei CBS 260.36]|uniref:Protein serine/threonine phosphatase 2C n=1 Tax=Myriangium duriaei CBS 260.36 TaxID=1168546 RepID=A0A9P4J1J9_9PEZI|nr:protein serine/threonine phosphatase 2C [Myriangium duriaei CBS 260.36]
MYTSPAKMLQRRLCLGLAKSGHANGGVTTLRTNGCKHYSTNGARPARSILRPQVIALSLGIGFGATWWATRSRSDQNTLSQSEEPPRLEDAPLTHLMVDPGFSDDEVTRTLAQGSFTRRVTKIAGVDRYDGAQLASNSPCEDRYVHGSFSSPANEGKSWMAWGVFDGHAGWQTAELLKNQLPTFVRQSLSEAGSQTDDTTVQKSIVKGFLNLEDLIIKTALEQAQSDAPLRQKIKNLAPAFAGSCALLSLYDPTTRSLHVACTGDSRAVLGRRVEDGKWEAIALSVDQTGSNEAEVARINNEHPSETEIAKGGRVLGIMVSRAFGDSRWRYPLEVQEDLMRRFYGPALLTPRYDVRTPPYLTAEPVVTTTKIEAGRPSFLIMASDGLWDMLSNQEAVDMVGRWIESQGPGSKRAEQESTPIKERWDFSRYWKDGDWKFETEKTTPVDGNPAVHLIRGSLGGDNKDLVAARLAFTSPESRRVRDDITVQVVFFEGSARRE